MTTLVASSSTPHDDPSSSKHVRGDLINTWLKYIKKEWGQDGVNEARGLITQPDIHNKNFYSMSEYETLLGWVRNNHGEKHLRKGGRFVIKNFGLLSWIVRFASFRMIVEKMPTRIKEFYDFGKGELISKGDKTIIIHLYDICTTPDVCLVHQGLLEGALKATNTKGKVEHTDCIHKDGDYCEFVITME